MYSEKYFGIDFAQLKSRTHRLLGDGAHRNRNAGQSLEIITGQRGQTDTQCGDPAEPQAATATSADSSAAPASPHRRVKNQGGSFAIDDDVQLNFYRLQKTSEGNAALTPGEGAPVAGPTSVGTGRPVEEDKAKLSEIVDVLNDRFGTEFTKEDQLLFDQVAGDLSKDEKLAEQGRTNTLDQFRLVFDPKALAAIVARVERNEDVSNTILSNEELRALLLQLMGQKVFDAAQKESSAA